MDKNTVMTIIRFCIVITLLALVLFFWLDTSDAGFAAVCMTMASCFLSFSFGVMRLVHDEQSGLDKKRALMALGIYAAVCGIAVLIKLVLPRCA